MLPWQRKSKRYAAFRHSSCLTTNSVAQKTSFPVIAGASSLPVRRLGKATDQLGVLSKFGRTKCPAFLFSGSYCIASALWTVRAAFPRLRALLELPYGETRGKR